MRRKLAIAAALFVACAPFGGDDEPEAPPVEDVPDAAPREAATTTTGAETAAATRDAAPSPCATPPVHTVLCDDFEDPNFGGKWLGPGVGAAPQFDPVELAADAATASRETADDAPSGSHFARFTLKEPHGGEDCAYTWLHHRFTLDGPVKAVRLAFDLRVVGLTAPNATDKGTAAAYIEVINDQSDGTSDDGFVEYYVELTPTANLFTQWFNGLGVREAQDPPISTIANGKWVHVELRAAPSTDAEGITVNGATTTWAPKHPIGDIARADVGIGFACDLHGGDVEFDNVVITTE